jgi:hypothetical protein
VKYIYSYFELTLNISKLKTNTLKSLYVVTDRYKRAVSSLRSRVDTALYC